MVYKTLKTKGIPFKFKDGFGAGNSSTQDVVPNNVVADKDKDGNEIIFVKHGKGETYIPLKDNKKLAMNKIQHTRVGDDIHYYQNGVEGRGIVVKMSNEYVMVAKEDGDFEDIHINDTFFVKDIVVNKTWDMMDSGERTDVLTKAHAPSTRFITKDWSFLVRKASIIMRMKLKHLETKIKHCQQTTQLLTMNRQRDYIKYMTQQNSIKVKFKKQERRSKRKDKNV